MLKHIFQKHMNGCGIACIAMVANISYNRALKLTNPKRWFFQRVKQPNIHAIRDTLLSLNCFVDHWKEEAVPSLQDLNTPTMIVIRYRADCHHAVMWDPITQLILDPSRKLGGCENDYYQKLSSHSLSIINP